jgi:hypothetical protein
MKPICFDLTAEQTKLLKPLFKMVDKADKQGKRGAILAQLKGNSYGNFAVFVDKERADEINKIATRKDKK